MLILVTLIWYQVYIFAVCVCVSARPYWPYGVVLHVLGVQAGVEVHHGFEGSQVTVEEEQEQLELGVGGWVGQPLLQQADTLPRHGLLPWWWRRSVHTLDKIPKERTTDGDK